MVDMCSCSGGRSVLRWRRCVPRAQWKEKLSCHEAHDCVCEQSSIDFEMMSSSGNVPSVGFSRSASSARDTCMHPLPSLISLGYTCISREKGTAQHAAVRFFEWFSLSRADPCTPVKP